MAKLTTKERSEIPADEFAGPDRTFPIPDKDHAEAALADAPRAEAAGSIGSISAEERALDKHPTRVAIRRASHAVRSRM